MKNFVVLVDKNDKKIGLEKKLKCHQKKGILHRAFTILIFNNRGEVLIQKRSKNKMLWPLIWETSCSSHPGKGESYKKAGEKRLKKEFGFSCPLKMLGKFQYRSRFKNIGSEYEVCAFLKGNYNGKIKPNKKEIADWKWVEISKLNAMIKNKPTDYAPWLKKALRFLLKHQRIYENN